MAARYTLVLFNRGFFAELHGTPASGLLWQRFLIARTCSRPLLPHQLQRARPSKFHIKPPSSPPSSSSASPSIAALRIPVLLLIAQMILIHPTISRGCVRNCDPVTSKATRTLQLAISNMRNVAYEKTVLYPGNAPTSEGIRLPRSPGFTHQHYRPYLGSQPKRGCMGRW
ncbi:hypothetical protein BOTBODRAFT_448008 [Botryobasidium botryosum FD-172 SS1]|uniref:Uncharacterized protein n=1 Tax=Botryobasidium botryosum (strain FD-172 SS1) TaxID=930990 RepID=A0A067M7W4_BOTB1|nr:hypothetical protein BOTBODRAFT_448008 [Botryobasidium botryosum FD-172 SS1]